MPISIVDSPDPLSLASRTEECILADSDASLLLLKELKLYCDREANGRSFLIAGHRGAGKTTLVQNAFLRVWKENQKRSAKDCLTPLLVSLNGPSLLPRPEDMPREPVPPVPVISPDPAKAALPPVLLPLTTEPPKDRPKSTPQVALEQITLGIYQALAQELSFQFRRRILGQPPSRQRQERLELAAQLEVELYEYPEPARLRELWAGTGALENGVLFSPDSGRPADQGLRELVALTGACEAYRRISGTYTQTDKQKAEGKTNSQMSVSLESTKDLLSSLASLLTGALAGTGAFVATGGLTPAAVTGIASALGAAAVFKHSSSRSRDRSGSRESSFVLDTSVPTLERVLPILVSRLRDAGLAPIFLVDELDKVDDLRDRLKKLIPQLKKFVSESTFFCFLADRGYFEALKRLWEESAFPVEYTYFTHQLYVLHRAEDLHDYLGKILKAPQIPASPLPGGALEPEAADARKLAEANAGKHTSGAEADYPVLPYVLLHRSRMHPIDLRRELALLRSSDNSVKLPEGRVRSAPAFRVDLILQIAIEMVLDDDRLAEELECHPVFRRLAYDALYYLSWLWQKERDPNLSDDNRAEFETYLVGRMGREARQGEEEIRLPENDLRFLHEKVRQIAELVAGLQQSYRSAFEHWKDRRAKRGKPLAAEVETALGLPYSPPPPLERVNGEAWHFRWRVDASGLSADDKKLSPALPSPELPDLWDNVELIEILAEGLGRLTADKGTQKISFTTLTSQYRILGTSPAWEETQRAIARLKSLQEIWRPYPEFVEDKACVDSFADMLRRSDRLLIDALFASATLGTVSAKNDPGDRLLLGLLEVSRLNRLADLQEKESGERLQSLAQSLRNELELSPTEIPALSQGAGAWLANVREILVAANTVNLLKTRTLSQRKKASWQDWQTRLKRVSFGPAATFPPPHVPTVDDLVCAVANVSPANLLKPHLGEMSLVAWSEVLYWALADESPEKSACYTPAWMLYPALLSLGFPAGSWAPLANAFIADEITYSQRPIKEEKSILTDWDNRPDIPAAIQPRLLILRKTQDTALVNWKPSPRGAAIVLDTNIASRLGRSWPAPIASLDAFVPIDRIAIEFGAGEGSGLLHKALERVARDRGQSLPREPLLFRTEPGENGSANVARNLDELLALATQPG